MVNRNAARHLALVVSILLCFFVYMGYRYRSSAEPSGAPAPAASSGAAGTTPLMTVKDGQPKENPAIRVPIATPSGMPAAQGGRRDGPPDIVNLLDSGAAYQEPKERPAAGPAAPSGSIEESLLASAPPAAGGSGAITGLIPDAPQAKSPVAPPPATRPSPASERMPGSPIPPPPDSGTKPPEAERQEQLSLPPPPGGGAPAPAESGLRPAAASTQPPSGGAVPPPSGNGRPAVRPAPETPARPQANPPPAVSDRGTPPPPPPPPVAPQGGAGMNRPGEPAASESLRIYVIRPGDTLSRIAARELGSIALADNIVLLNRDVIFDPDHLVVGDRIRLPIRESLGPAAGPGTLPPPAGAVNRPPAGVPVPPAQPARGVQPAPAGSRVHQVARGETLSAIAQRYYGSSSAWRFLYESNRSVIANPNQLSVGTTLVIPPYAEPR